MIGLTIQTLNKGEVSDPSITDDMKPGTTLHEGRIDVVEIIQGGTTSGKTSIAFIISLPNGDKVIAQTTADLYRGILGAIDGNEQRWKGEGHG